MKNQVEKCPNLWKRKRILRWTKYCFIFIFIITFSKFLLYIKTTDQGVISKPTTPSMYGLQNSKTKALKSQEPMFPRYVVWYWIPIPSNRGQSLVSTATATRESKDNLFFSSGNCSQNKLSGFQRVFFRRRWKDLWKYISIPSFDGSKTTCTEN